MNDQVNHHLPIIDEDIGLYTDVYPVDEPLKIDDVSYDLKYVMKTYLDTIDLHPYYQRDISWSVDLMVRYITDTYYKRTINMPITLYNLQGESELEYETIDGQHRLFVFKYWFSGRPLPHIDSFSKNNMIYIRIKNSNKVLFYKENEHTRTWAKLNNRSAMYMCDDYYNKKERNLFLNIKVKFVIHNDYMTLDQRKAEFLSLQNGIKVTNSELYRNINSDLTNAIYENQIERLFVKSRLIVTCNPYKYRVQHMIRDYHIVKNPDQVIEYLVTLTDKKLGDELSKRNTKHLGVTSQAEFNKFMIVMKRMVIIAETHDTSNKTKLSPIAYYALLHRVACMTNDEFQCRYPIINTYISSCADNGFNATFNKKAQEHLDINSNDIKALRTIWERKHIFNTPEFKTKIFNICGELIDSYITERPKLTTEPVCDRKQLSPKHRMIVWKKTYGQANDGVCSVCKLHKIHSGKHGFHTGHIIAHTKGGTSDLKNLLAICNVCNIDMGIQDLYEYKKTKIS